MRCRACARRPAARDVDVAAAATLAELAGADAIRLGVGEELRPVREADVRQARRGARELELRMPPSQTLLKVALDARPDRVLLAAEARDGAPPSSPLDLRGRSHAARRGRARARRGGHRRRRRSSLRISRR